MVTVSKVALRMNNRVGLASNCIVKGLFGEVTRLVRRVENLIVEYREVKGQAKSDWVRRCKVGLRDFGGVLVGLQ